MTDLYAAVSSDVAAFRFWGKVDLVHDRDMWEHHRWVIDGEVPAHFAIRFTSRDGREAIVHPSTSQLGVQTTWIATDGEPWGDSKWPDLASALADRELSPAYWTIAEVMQCA